MTTTSPTTYPAVLSNGILTSYVPMTTSGSAFNSECSSIYMPPGITGLAGFDPWMYQNVITTLNCLVEQQTTYWDQTAAPSTSYALGPFVCPSDYSTATISTLNSLSTLIACCPSGYTYQNQIFSAPTPSQCISTLTSGKVVEYYGLSSSTWTPNSTTIGAGGFIVWGAHINGFIFNDAVTTSSSSSSTSTSSSSTAPATNTAIQTSSSPSSTASPAQPSSGLSSGAKIGIGIGVALGAIGMACLLAAWLLLKRRKSKGTLVDTASQNENGQFLGVPRNDDGYSTTPTTDVRKHDYVSMSEMPAQSAPEYRGPVHEVDARTEPVEMG